MNRIADRPLSGTSILFVAEKAGLPPNIVSAVFLPDSTARLWRPLPHLFPLRFSYRPLQHQFPCLR